MNRPCLACGGPVEIPSTVTVFRMVMETVSLSNLHRHYRVRNEMVSTQRGHTGAVFPPKLRGAGEYEGKWRVGLTRIAPRALDDDNLHDALKGVRDEVTKRLGFKTDKDPRLRFHYWQQKGNPKEHAVIVEIWCEGT